MKKTEILGDVADYYSAKLFEHGETPQGVDWNGIESQVLRFQQLSKVIMGVKGFSLNDIGCGYGALFEFLSSNFKGFNYEGCDVSVDMISASKKRFSKSNNAKFIEGAMPSQNADYCIASGIFNVKLQWDDEVWYEYILKTLNTLDKFSHKGFSLNCLTSYSDPEKKRDYLYYADPCQLFDYCKRHYSGQVALLHDYGLYEFTILVKK